MPENVDYWTLPLDKFTVRDLTDALGVEQSAQLLNMTKRAIYTTRNTNVLGIKRMLALIDEIRRVGEPACRERIIVLHNMRQERAERKKAA